MMNTPHKHAEAIKAWADGKSVEFRASPDQPWQCLGTHQTRRICPAFLTDKEYRVAPDPRFVYRVFLWTPSVYHKPTLCIVTRDENDSQPREKWSNFICWVSDWTEVDPEAGNAEAP
jgi:hypothetical protein